MTITEGYYLSGKGQNLNLVQEYKAGHQHLGLIQHQSETDHQRPGLVQHQDDDQLQDRDHEFQHNDHFHQRVKEQEVKYQHQGDQDPNLLSARELNLPSLQDQNHFQGNVHHSIDFSHSQHLGPHQDHKFIHYSMLSMLQILLSQVHQLSHRE